MKVLGTQFNRDSSRQIQPSFGNWNYIVQRTQYPKRHIDIDRDMFKIKHQTKTAFFRYEDYLPDGLDYAVKKFKNKKHVNFYSYGCSNCSETYSILMYMVSKYGEDIARKFTPIFARDYEKVAILRAKSGVLPISQQEYERIQKYTGGRFEEFFLPNKPLNFSKCKNIEVPVNPKYYSMIDIQQADIRTDYANIPPEDTILTTMNFLPYLPDNDNQQLVYNIANHLNRKSMWWFGPYELQSSEYFIHKVSHSGFSNENRPLGIYEKLPFTTFEGIRANIMRIIYELNNL